MASMNSATRSGSKPPLVSHGHRQAAPASWATISVRKGVLAVGREAVEEVLGVEKDRAPLGIDQATESSISARFSSRVMRRISVAGVEDFPALPKMVMTGAPEAD